MLEETVLIITIGPYVVRRANSTLNLSHIILPFQSQRPKPIEVQIIKSPQKGTEMRLSFSYWKQCLN